MKMLLIANPKSGKGAAQRVLPKVRDFFEKNYVELEIYLTKKQGDAINKAKRAALSGKYEVIIASGGDGTLNEVINGIMLSGKNKKQKLGIIPLGTENVLARETKMPFNPIKAAQVIMEGNMIRMDVGKANKRYFFLMTGIGFDAHVATRVQPLLKRFMGSTAYTITAWNELFKYQHSDIDVVIDGKKKASGSFVVIGNTKLYGGGLKMTPKASLQDGFLDVCIFKGKDVISFLRYGIGGLTEKHIKYSDIEYHKAKKVTVRSKPRALWHVDCEIGGKTPVEVRVIPKALNLIVK
ncbi:YegS/Rv2252/BmrU family lipid kinase [Candidatus Woesearchaeota archaeon]|nr:YegS/Rv2252/BmrU family lipid kinase [Candidatus Woesearchaeota archaeon]